MQPAGRATTGFKLWVWFEPPLTEEYSITPDAVRFSPMFRIMGSILPEHFDS
jgi:hypothetical protein